MAQGRAPSLLLNVRLFLSGPATLFHFHLGRDVEVAEFERCDNLILRLPVPFEASHSQRDRSCLFGAKKGVGSKAKEREL